MFDKKSELFDDDELSKFILNKQVRRTEAAFFRAE